MSTSNSTVLFNSTTQSLRCLGTMFAGNVGIGTTQPQARLHIYEGATSGDLFRVDDVASGADTTPFIINTNGNVGIGTTVARITGLDVIGDMLITANSSTGIKVSKTGANSSIKILTDNVASGLDLVCEYTTSNAYIIQRENASLAFRTNNVERVRIDNLGNVGIGTTLPLNKLHIVGNIKTTDNSINYIIGSGTAVAISSATPTTVVSLTITTTGKPVFVICSGDLQPVNNTADWINMRLYRGDITIGYQQVIHPGTGASTNQGFAIHAIDVVGAGTYTYTLKAWQGSGSILFGEVQMPYFCAMEFL